MDVVFVPEAVSKLDVLELASDNTSKRGSQHCTGEGKLRHSRIEQIDVVHMTEIFTRQGLVIVILLGKEKVSVCLNYLLMGRM